MKERRKQALITLKARVWLEELQKIQDSLQAVVNHDGGHHSSQNVSMILTKFKRVLEGLDDGYTGVDWLKELKLVSHTQKELYDSLMTRLQELEDACRKIQSLAKLSSGMRRGYEKMGNEYRDMRVKLNECLIERLIIE